MRCAALQGARILHHAFDAVWIMRTRKFFGLALDAFDDRHCGFRNGKVVHICRGCDIISSFASSSVACAV